MAASSASTGGALASLEQDAHQDFTSGSIRRVTATDFMTHSNVVFRMSARLNLIIGPNGAGKSTFVAAVILGLGGTPSMMDRGSSHDSFIRQGATQSSVTVELQDEATGSVAIVYRMKRGGRPSYRLRGKPASAHEVNQFVSSFGIKVDNLCQFLPQEKITEFTHIEPPKLLTAVERSFGHGELYQQHRQLIDMQNNFHFRTEFDEQKERESRLAHQFAQLDQELQAREHTRRLQERLREVSDLLLVYRALEVQKECKDAKDALEARKQQRDTYASSISGLETAREEARNELRRCKEERAQIERSFRSYARAEEERRAARKESTVMVERLSDDLRSLRRRQAQTQTRILRQEEGLRIAKEELAAMPAYDELRAQCSELDTAVRTNRADTERVEIALQQRQQHEQACDRAFRQAKDAVDRLRVQRNAPQQTLDTMANSSSSHPSKQDFRREKNALEVIKGLHRAGRLRGQVLGPLWQLINPTTRLAQQAVSTVLSRQVMGTFLVTHKEDFDTLDEALKEQGRETTQAHSQDSASGSSSGGRRKEEARPEERWRVPITILRDDAAGGGSGSRVWGRDALAHFGEKGYTKSLMEYLRAPPLVRLFLRRRAKLDSVMVNFERGSDEELSAKSDSGRRLVDLVPANASVVTTRRVVRVSRNRVAQGTIPETQMLRRAPESLIQCVPSDEDITAAEKDARSQGKALEEARKERAEAETALQERRSRGKDVLRQRAEAKSRLQRVRAVRSKVESQESALERLKRELTADTTADQTRILREMLQASVQQFSGLSETREFLEEITRLRARLTHAALRVEVHQQHVSDVEQAMEMASEKLRSFTTQVTLAEHEYKRRTRDKRAAVERVPEPLRMWPTPGTTQAELREREQRLVALMNKYGSLKCAADADDDIADLRRQLQDHDTADTSVEERHDFVQQQLTQVREHIARLKDRLDSEEARREELRSAWRSKLDECITKVNISFQEAMQRLGCKGEVRFKEDETNSFRKHGLEIRVAFRRDSPLQALKHTTQSGGERAVSTMVFLIALQQSMPCPFRLVDEINQGMDGENERMVFREIMRTCGTQDPGGSQTPNRCQYIVITPKLLSNMTYGGACRVHTIFNGEYLDKPILRLSLRRILSGRKRTSREIADAEDEDDPDASPPDESPPAKRTRGR